MKLLTHLIRILFHLFVCSIHERKSTAVKDLQVSISDRHIPELLYVFMNTTPDFFFCQFVVTGVFHISNCQFSVCYLLRYKDSVFIH